MAGGRISRLGSLDGDGMQRLTPDVSLLILTLDEIMEDSWSDPLID
jgi:hypothetical protein